MQTDALAHPDQTEPGLLLWLALAAIAVVEHVDLERALALAPQMAADARLAEAPDVEEVATAVCWAADGPAQRLRSLEEWSARLIEDANRSPALKAVPAGLAPLTIPNDGVDALLLVHAALPGAIRACVDLMADVRARLARLQATTRRHAK